MKLEGEMYRRKRSRENRTERIVYLWKSVREGIVRVTNILYNFM